MGTRRKVVARRGGDGRAARRRWPAGGGLGRAGARAAIAVALAFGLALGLSQAAHASDIDYFEDDVQVIIPAPSDAEPAGLDAAPAAASSRVGEWVTFLRSEGTHLTQVSDYFIASSANPDGTINVTVRTTLYNKGGNGHVFWTTTKTIYDNGAKCAYIGPDWDSKAYAGQSISQEATFTVSGGGVHRITSTETLFRGSSATMAGWDFTVNIPFRITASAGTGGTISPSGHALVNVGGSKTYAISALKGYRVLDVKVDGKSVGARTSYTFSNISADHTIVASFKKTWSVTFKDGVTGSTISKVTVDDGKGAAKPTPPTHDGWRFDGWDKDSSNIKGDTTITATYTKLHTVTFKDWDGSTLKTQVVPNGSGAQAPKTPSRDGWSFTGWDKDFSRISKDTVVTSTYAPVIHVRVPTVLPCKILADGTVVAPSDYVIENLSAVPVRSTSIKTSGMPSDASYTLSCDGATAHSWKGSDVTSKPIRIAKGAKKNVQLAVSPVTGNGSWRALAQRAATAEQGLCTITYTFEWDR